MSDATRRNMQGWREPILRQFPSDIATTARLTIVSDPDELLSEQGVLEALQGRGFDLLHFNDHVAFRYEYETRYRERWDRGEETSLVVVLRTSETDVGTLPFDLLQKARSAKRLLSFSIGELFPHLTPRIIAQLDRSDLDALYDAQSTVKPGQLGDNMTKDFVLQHVFSVVPGIIKSDVDLLKLLLERHYPGRAVPPELDDRLIELLRANDAFSDWPLEDIVTRREAFFAFLQERWPVFVRKVVAKANNELGEPSSAYGLRYAGPTDLPFDHDSIRVYVDNMFIDGYLTPTDAVRKDEVQDDWIRFGVSGEPVSDASVRFEKLTALVTEGLPRPNADYGEWLKFAARWGEWSALRWTLTSDAGEDPAELQDDVETRFEEWMLEHFAAVSSVSYFPRPAIVHKVAHFMAHDWSRRGPEKPKLALVIVDGMAMAQWSVLREIVKKQLPTIELSESAMFAWVPTLTTVSRQAILAGEPPLFFGPTIDTTAREPKLWSRFWEQKGIPAAGIQYVGSKLQEPDSGFVDRVKEVAEDPRTRVVAVVAGTVDQMMHGAVTGMRGFQAQVQHWAEDGHLSRVLKVLLERSFQVFITADHGNVEATGFGRPNEGVTVEERGARARVFRNEHLRATVHSEYRAAIEWPAIGLPEDYHPLLAPKRMAFISKEMRTIGHGGISLEEVVVPFVEIVSQ